MTSGMWACFKRYLTEELLLVDEDDADLDDDLDGVIADLMAVATLMSPTDSAKS